MYKIKLEEYIGLLPKRGSAFKLHPIGSAFKLHPIESAFKLHWWVSQTVHIADVGVKEQTNLPE